MSLYQAESPLRDGIGWVLSNRRESARPSLCIPTVVIVDRDQAACRSRTAAAIPICNFRPDCWSIFPYPLGRSSLMGHLIL